MNHFVQISTSKKFQKYDYGSIENFSRYGQTTPPEISLANVKTPIGIFAGTDDELVNIINADWDCKALGKNIKHFGAYKLGHLSFLIAEDPTYWSVDAMNLIQEFHPSKPSEFYE